MSLAFDQMNDISLCLPAGEGMVSHWKSLGLSVEGNKAPFDCFIEEELCFQFMRYSGLIQEIWTSI